MSDQPAATLRDVYDLVKNSRLETAGKIDDLGTKFDEFARSNEHRLTVVETHQAAQAHQVTELVTQVHDHRERLGAVEGKLRADDRTKRAKSTVWTKRNMWIGSILSLIMAVSSGIAIANAF